MWTQFGGGSLKRIQKERWTPQRGHHFWLRSEYKAMESRVILLPHHTKQLIQSGHQVTVEKCNQRCVPIHHYTDVGCSVAESGFWPKAPKDAIILGLKELPSEPKELIHNHVFFGHCYKGQQGSKELLNRFKRGGGSLWDLEYLVDQNNRRVAAFGFAAGMIGMALGILCWANIKNGVPTQPITRTWKTYQDLADFISRSLPKTSEKPQILVVGALGRVGSGATKFASLLDIQPTEWDAKETAGKSGPFREILDYDIFVNTILLKPSEKKFLFLDKETISQDRKLSVISDISCDQSNPANPLPIFGGTTDFSNPSFRIIQNPPLEIIAIDHLPSLVPEESSNEFGSALLPHLNDYANSIVWKNSQDIFKQHMAAL
eukprot:TRINITY_DN7169_c0_g1_i1.p1 TRINITY_DN7169_c0_g1~~TRINITY_DN7169_c0_g1_i1.p1  ORF type:complete len:375 (+),score=84.83 TRINITY_DN7169_c0_g1_i1:49-1173(+)